MPRTLGGSSSCSIVRVRADAYDKRHYPKLDNYASSGFGFLKKLAMDGWFAGAAGPFFETSLGV